MKAAARSIDFDAVQRAWRGCRVAATRYNESRATQDADATYAAAFEVLNWIAAIDGALGLLHTDQNTPCSFFDFANTRAPDPPLRRHPLPDPALIHHVRAQTYSPALLTIQQVRRRDSTFASDR